MEKGTFLRKWPEKFNPPIQSLLIVLHQNKALHNFFPGMFTNIFTLQSKVPFLNIEGVRPMLESNTLKQRNTSSLQNLVTIELKYRILYK